MTREEFIGKLRSIYVGEENAIDEIISEYDRIKEIIEKKDTFYDSLAVDYRLAQEEIDRLNNIINELEKSISQRIDLFKKTQKDESMYGEITNKLDELYYIYGKIKALKEDNNGNN